MKTNDQMLDEMHFLDENGKEINGKNSQCVQWISVKERLPELYDYVLVFADYQGCSEPRPISIARLNPDEVWDFLHEYDDGGGKGVYMDLEYPICCGEDITHWMPLPRRPDEKWIRDLDLFSINIPKNAIFYA